jgi:arylsulfatase A-like enzyme
MPTLLSLLGLPTPQGVEGMDLSHCALGKPGAEPDAAFLLGMGNNFLRPDGYEWRALRSKRHTYALWRADQREELYDNLADPYQMHNLAKDPAYERIRRELREMLAIRMAQLNDEFRGLSWYREHWTQNRIITHTGAATQ